MRELNSGEQKCHIPAGGDSGGNPGGIRQDPSAFLTRECAKRGMSYSSVY